MMAPLAAPFALGWAYCCVDEAGGGFAGCDCADARGTITVVMDSAIPKHMIFTERFM
jgi:hypothetical protein